LKRLILIGLSVLLMCAGLVTINCKSESKEGESGEVKTSVELNDSIFVEIIVKQGLMMQKYQLQGQQAESDSARQLILDEFNAEIEKMMSDYGVSEEQFKAYAEEIESDSERVKELQEKIVSKSKKLMMEKSEDAGKQVDEKTEK